MGEVNYAPLIDDMVWSYSRIKAFEDCPYIGYVSGNEADRRKLYITDMKPLVRRRDGEQFAYSVFTKSIGSGKESRFTLFNREFKKEPVKVGDIIYCKGYQRDGEYFKLTAYDKVL